MGQYPWCATVSTRYTLSQIQICVKYLFCVGKHPRWATVGGVLRGRGRENASERYGVWSVVGENGSSGFLSTQHVVQPGLAGAGLKAT